MIAENPWRFTGILGVLVRLFQARHEFRFLGDLDSVTNQDKSTTTGTNCPLLHDKLQPVGNNFVDLQSPGSKKSEKTLVRSGKESQPADAQRYAMVVESDNEAKDCHDKPRESRRSGKSRTIRPQQHAELTYHFAPLPDLNGQPERRTVAGCCYSCLNPKVLGATRLNRTPFLISLLMAEDKESRSSCTPNSFSTAARISETCNGFPASPSTFSTISKFDVRLRPGFWERDVSLAKRAIRPSLNSATSFSYVKNSSSRSKECLQRIKVDGGSLGEYQNFNCTSRIMHVLLSINTWN